MRVLDLDRALAVLSEADTALVAAAAATMLATVLIRVHRWRLSAMGCGLPGASFAYYLRVYYIGAFVGAVVPSALSAFLPAYFISRDGLSARRAAVSVLLDRLVEVGLLAILVLPAAAHLFAEERPRGLKGEAFVAAGVVLASLGLLALWRLRAWIASKGGRAMEWSGLDSASKQGMPALLLKLGGWSGLIVAIQVLAAFLVAQAVDINVSGVLLGSIYLVVLAITTLPISLLGFGPREGMLVLLLTREDVAKEQAFAMGIIISLIVAAVRLPGLVAWMLSLQKITKLGESHGSRETEQ